MLLLVFLMYERLETDQKEKEISQLLQMMGFINTK